MKPRPKLSLRLLAVPAVATALLSSPPDLRRAEAQSAAHLGTPGNYTTDRMPPAGQLIGGEIAWRQHEGGHSVAENRPSFVGWASRFIKSPELKRARSVVSPVARDDRSSTLAHRRLLEKAKEGRIDIYFEGDSITRRWGTSDEQYKQFLANWRQNFYGWNAADFGWGGDTTRNILWRLENGELDGVNPRIIVLMAGTNDVGNSPPQGADDPRVADTVSGVEAILNVCRRKAPRARIVLMGVTPRNDNPAVMPLINRINERVARLADGKRIRYLNINGRLADKDGKLREGMAVADGLHLDVKGYQVWADALKPIFTKLLGPPAKEDHAPPPTGDPSQERH